VEQKTGVFFGKKQNPIAEDKTAHRGGSSTENAVSISFSRNLPPPLSAPSANAEAVLIQL
jgi:hypothetical protein